MALFSRRASLLEQVKALRAELGPSAPAPLPQELDDLARFLKPTPATEPKPDELAQLQGFLDALPDPSGVLEAKGKLVRANNVLDQLLGGRSVGRTLLEGTRSSELQEAAERSLQGSCVKREVNLPALQKVVMASLAPLPGGRALVVLRDLTEQKRIEQSRRDFVANASHELRTPVAAISGAVETLLSEAIELNGPARGFVEMVQRHSSRLTRLTQDLLDLSKLESGEWRVELGAVELTSLFDVVVELVRSRATPRGVQLAADAPNGLRVLADRRALEQILVNLIDNAIKFSPEGGRVTLLADNAGAHVLISVIDHGQGIEARHLQRIFERFYRVDGGRAREAGGTGLGLAIVKHLVQAQGGEVGVESGQGGSRFWVKLKSAPAT
ncbi:MAG: two-component sensor histidine kinase [Deltaproteobacteria bacterium]|nr:two-component sensor histidine kinase [Deltaproteobacteria bacterium]